MESIRLRETTRLGLRPSVIGANVTKCVSESATCAGFVSGREGKVSKRRRVCRERESLDVGGFRLANFALSKSPFLHELGDLAFHPRWSFECICKLAGEKRRDNATKSK